MPSDAIARFDALSSPAAERNKAPILEALKSRLPQRGMLFEIASGALQHALHIAPHFPELHWQPSELDQRVLDQASGYISALASRWPANIRPPQCFDASKRPWNIERADVIYTANLLHIAPLSVTNALFAEADATLSSSGQLIIYGPFKVEDRFRSDGDARFDESLRQRNADWGIRDLELLEELAHQGGLEMLEQHPMPANNLLLRFTRIG